MSELYHKQCVLTKGNLTKVAWLPSQFARKGKIVDLLEDEGWEKGWKVDSIGVMQETKAMLERSQDYKKTREASDI